MPAPDFACVVCFVAFFSLVCLSKMTDILSKSDRVIIRRAAEVRAGSPGPSAQSLGPVSKF